MSQSVTIPAKKVICTLHLYEWLKNAGHAVEGVCRVALDNNVGVIIISADGAPDPTALVNSYTNPDYYEFLSTATNMGPIWSVGHIYPHVQASIGGTLTITINKRKGLDDSILPDNDTLDLHWHGPKMGQPATVTLVNGIGQVIVSPLKRARVIVEAVPTGSVDMASKLPTLVRGGAYLHVD